VVSYESIREWGLRFGRIFAKMLKRRRPQPGDRWYMDQVFIRIRGKQHYLWRAVDQDGNVLDIQSRAGAAPQRPRGSSASYHFQLRRHHLSANQHCAARDAAFRTWRDVAEVVPAA
jgi:hypothetical protein